MANLEVLRLTTHLSRILKGEAVTSAERLIYQRFWSVFSREMFQAMYTSYRNRSRNQSDELPAWKVLKPATIKAKRRPGKRSKIKPSLHPSWINFDSGRLLMSFKPGSMSGERYTPMKDQLWKLTPDTLTLGSRVPYAEDVNELRELFGNSSTSIRVMTGWAKKAAKAAAKSIVPLLGTLEKTTIYGATGFKEIIQKGLL